jgi:hypothetical protein
MVYRYQEEERKREMLKTRTTDGGDMTGMYKCTLGYHVLPALLCRLPSLSRFTGTRISAATEISIPFSFFWGHLLHVLNPISVVPPYVNVT